MGLQGQIVHGGFPVLPRQRRCRCGPQIAHLSRGKDRPLAQPGFNRRAVAFHAVPQKAELLLRLGGRKRLVQILIQLGGGIFHYPPGNLSRLKRRAVDLPRPCVLNGTDQVRGQAHAPDQRFQCIHRHAGLACAVGHALYRTDADANAGEGAGADHRRIQVDLGNIRRALVQRFLHHGHQADGMGQPVHGRALVQNFSFFQHRHAAYRAGGVHRQQFHSSLVSFSFSPSMA